MSETLARPEDESFALAVAAARGRDLAEAAGQFAKSLVQFYSRPEKQAFLGGVFAGSFWAASHRARPAFGMLCGLVAGLAAERAYWAVHDVHSAALAVSGRFGRDSAGEPDVPDPR